MTSMTASETSELPLKWGWLLLLGLGLVLAGTAGLFLSYYLTLASVILFGALALVAGMFLLWYGVSQKAGNWSGRALQLLVAVAYLLLGGLLLWDPVGGSLSLTLVLAAFLFALGVSRLIYAWKCRRRGWRWGWMFVGGLLNLLLGGLIVVGFPSSAFWVIGLFVAIEMLVSGWLLIGIALAVRVVSKGADRRSSDSYVDESAHASD